MCYVILRKMGLSSASVHYDPNINQKLEGWEHTQYIKVNDREESLL